VSARPVSMTSDMSASGGSGLYGDHIGRQQLIAGRTESEQTPLSRDQNRRQRAQQSTGFVAVLGARISLRLMPSGSGGLWC